MLQALLGDRFALKVHQETRELPIYALVVAKGGPRFQASTINGTTIRNGNAYITVTGSDHTVALLAEQLSRTLGRVVVDKTGLDGRYELTLKWSTDEVADGPGGPSADAGPSIFTAIQEQLGLKLESGKGPYRSWSSITSKSRRRIEEPGCGPGAKGRRCFSWASGHRSITCSSSTSPQPHREDTENLGSRAGLALRLGRK
jgi:hypothetical protein